VTLINEEPPNMSFMTEGVLKGLKVCISANVFPLYSQSHTLVLSFLPNLCRFDLH